MQLMLPFHDKTHFSSEVVRCGASQKKPLWDSSKTYSPKGFTFRDVPQIAAYHEKLAQEGEKNTRRNRRTYNTRNVWTHCVHQKEV